MTFLPILERELRVRARNRAMYWTRAAVVLVGLVIVLPQLAGVTFTAPALVGQQVFKGIIAAAFVLCCSACLLTADALSAERREGTLGLLFLTRVKAADVLLGKLGSYGLTSLCALLSFLPLLVVPLLAGGVTGGEAFRKALALLATLFLALAAGLFASAFWPERFKALRAAGFIILGLMLLFPLGGPLGLFSPLFCLIGAGDTAYRVTPAVYWISLALVQVVAWLLLVRARVGLRRAVCQEAAGPAEASSATSSPPQRAARSNRWKPQAGEESPVQWLIRRQRGLRTTLWVAAAIGGLGQFWSLLFARAFSAGTFMSSRFMLMQMPYLAIHMVAGALFAWAVSRFLVEARRSGEVELLLSTPLGARTLISAQWTGLKHLLQGPLFLLLLPILIQLLFLLTSQIGPTGSWKMHYAVSMGFGIFSTCLGLGALCWTGLWFGLKARNQAEAIGWTIALAKGVPFLISILGRSLIGTLFNAFGPSPRGILSTCTWWLPQLAILLFYVCLIRGAKRRLLGELAVAETLRWNLQQSLAETAATIRKARHWTPL